MNFAMRTTGVSVFGARPVWLAPSPAVHLSRWRPFSCTASIAHLQEIPGIGAAMTAAALVEDQLEFNALFFKILQRQRDAVAADLLIVGGGEPQVAGRLEALPQQLLKSRKFREQRRFRIHCAAAPELTVRDLRGKWRVLPLPVPATTSWWDITIILRLWSLPGSL